MYKLKLPRFIFNHVYVNTPYMYRNALNKEKKEQKYLCLKWHTNISRSRFFVFLATQCIQLSARTVNGIVAAVPVKIVLTSVTSRQYTLIPAPIS